MLLLFPFTLYLLQLSLKSAEGFVQVQTMMSGWPVHILSLLLLWLFAHHLFAGVRVLFIDLDWGSDLITARRTAWIALIAGILVAIAGALL